MAEKPGGNLSKLETEIPGKSATGAVRGGAAIKPGTVLLHTYQILNVIGTGGMGEVYRARHLQLGTSHAIKVVRPELVESQTAHGLFVQEASVLREIRHDAIVQYDGLFQDEGGRVYLVMEFVEGRRLSDLLRERRALSIEQAWKLYGRLARGLAAVHGRGIVHRDLSPDNIILPGGRPEHAKLIDFGIAKVEDPRKGTTTEDGGFAGKYAFASPEQLGAFGGQVDARSDLYSLGLVLAAAATGQLLPMGADKEEAIEARRKVPRLPRAIPRALRKEIKSLLRPDPRNRPSAQDLVKRDLIRVRSETRGKEREPGRLALIVGYGFAVVVGISVAVWLSGTLPTAALFERLFPREKLQQQVVTPPVPPKPPEGEKHEEVKKPPDDIARVPEPIPSEDIDLPGKQKRSGDDRGPRKKDPQWGQIEREGAIQVE